MCMWNTVKCNESKVFSLNILNDQVIPLIDIFFPDGKDIMKTISQVDNHLNSEKVVELLWDIIFYTWFDHPKFLLILRIFEICSIWYREELCAVVRLNQHWCKVLLKDSEKRNNFPMLQDFIQTMPQWMRVQSDKILVCDLFLGGY